MDKLRMLRNLQKFPFLEWYNAPTACQITPCRTTYILKRKFAPNLSRVGSTRHRALEEKHKVYELVEDTNLKEPPDVPVVLTTFVEGVGDVGDVMTTMADYARYHLLLPKKAVYATPENVEYYSKLKKERPERPEFSSIFAGMTVRFLSKKVVPVFMSSEQPWEIKPWHIRVAFRMEGIVLPEEAVELPEPRITGPDPTKEGRDFAVTVTINNTETVPVRCRLFHINKDIGITKLSEEFYLEKKEAILQEQNELLAGLPDPEIEDNRPESNISLKEKYRIKFIE